MKSTHRRAPASRKRTATRASARAPAGVPSAPDPAADRRLPDVIVDFVFERGLLHVAVENLGEAPALGVSVSFDRKFRGLGGSREMSRLKLFRRIEFLAPRRRVETLLDA